MARRFKMHRAGPARHRAATAPLGSRAKRTAGRSRLAEGQTAKAAESAASPVKEIGGPEGPEPTRYGDWEKNGICYDF